jgi:hypothetical protein
MCPEAASPKKGPEKNIGIKREKREKNVNKISRNAWEKSRGTCPEENVRKIPLSFFINFIKLFGGKIKVC